MPGYLAKPPVVERERGDEAGIVYLDAGNVVIDDDAFPFPVNSRCVGQQH